MSIKYLTITKVSTKFIRTGMTVICLSSTSFAQSIRFGPEAGGSYNFSYQESLSGAPYTNKVSGNKFSYRAGLPVVVNLARGLRVNTGLYYAAKGMPGYPPPGSGIVLLTYNMLELPAVLVWNKADEEHNSFFIGAGPYIGYGLSNKARWQVSPGVKKQESAEWGKDIKRMDWGAQLQLGYQLRSGLFIKLLAQRSLANMGVQANNENFKSYTAYAQVRNDAHFALSLGYLFAFRHKY